MKVGVTGSREGLTDSQIASFGNWFTEHRSSVTELHHGCCVGADEYVVARFYLRPETKAVRIYGYPPKNCRWISEWAKYHSEGLRNPAEYLERNEQIVLSVNLLLAFPKSQREELRSGTWATVRRARKAGKRVVLFLPDGTVTEE